jgi:hypothetical protein
MKTSRTVIVALLAVLALAGISGARVAHPKDGLSNALGSASSGVVLYRHSSTYDVGSKILVQTNVPSKSPVLAVVRAATATTVDIQVGGKLQRVGLAQVTGKLIAVVPFIGSILGIFGP